MSEPLPDVTITGVAPPPPAPPVEDLTRVRMAPRARAFRDEVTALMRKHGKLAPDQMLAIAAHVAGTALAVQDPRKTSTARADAIIRVNLANGLYASQRELLQARKLGE